MTSEVIRQLTGMTGLLSTLAKNASRMDDPTDYLVQQAKSGCHQSYAELIRKNRTLVRSIIGCYLRRDDEVDEVAQRVFVAAYHALPGFQTRSSLETWLVSIAKNQVANFLRSEARRRKHESVLTEEVVKRATDDADHDTDSVNEKIAALSECIELLPEQRRDMIRRYYFAHESIASISDQEERTPGSLRMVLMRIRQALAKCISKRLAAREG